MKQFVDENIINYIELIKLKKHLSEQYDNDIYFKFAIIDVKFNVNERIPEYLIIKEWAYLRLSFLLSGGIVSHFASGDGILPTLPVFMFMRLTIISWYLRPTERRLIPLK